MPDAPRALLLDFLDWLASAPRRYDDALATWRTSCPRLPVWEDAFAEGLVRHCMRDGEATVELTAAGRGWLITERPSQ